MSSLASVNVFQGALVVKSFLVDYIGFGQAQDGAQMFHSVTDPNTVITAPKGSMALDVTGPFIWQNTDSVTAWEKVGLQS